MFTLCECKYLPQSSENVCEYLYGFLIFGIFHVDQDMIPNHWSYSRSSRLQHAHELHVSTNGWRNNVSIFMFFFCVSIYCYELLWRSEKCLCVTCSEWNSLSPYISEKVDVKSVGERTRKEEIYNIIDIPSNACEKRLDNGGLWLLLFKKLKKMFEFLAFASISLYYSTFFVFFFCKQIDLQ